MSNRLILILLLFSCNILFADNFIVQDKISLKLYIIGPDSIDGSAFYYSRDNGKSLNYVKRVTEYEDYNNFSITDANIDKGIFLLHKGKGVDYGVNYPIYHTNAKGPYNHISSGTSPGFVFMDSSIYSTDFGETVIINESEGLSGDIIDITSGQSDSSWFVLTDEGLFFSSNYGQNYLKQYSFENRTPISFSTGVLPGEVYLQLNDSTDYSLYHSFDYGLSFQKKQSFGRPYYLTPGDSLGELYLLHIFDHIYMGFPGRTYMILHTHNYGETYKEGMPIHTTYEAIFTGTSFFKGQSQGELYFYTHYSNDYGQSAEKIKNYGLGQFELNENDGLFYYFFYNTKGEIYRMQNKIIERSTDRGKTFYYTGNIPDYGSNRFGPSCISTSTQGEVYFCNNYNGQIFYSSNYGSSFTLQSENINYSIESNCDLQISAGSSQGELYMAKHPYHSSETSILYSDDFGKTFSSNYNFSFKGRVLGGFEPGEVFFEQHDEHSDTIYIYIYHSQDYGITWEKYKPITKITPVIRDQNKYDKNKFEFNLKCYPNPFNSTITINYEITDLLNGNIVLSIYDIKGRLIKSFHDLDSSPGEHNLNWQAKNDHNQEISSGIYTVWFKADNLTASKKLLYIK